MTKYNLETKYRSVKAYLNDNESFSLIAKRIGTHRSNIREWVESYTENGIYGLKIKHKKKQYDLKFKLKVIKYYQNHDEGQITVGAKFNINRSQVHSWVKKFNFYGINGLRPSPKGRPPKMTMSKKKKNNNLSLSERQAYEKEILRLKNKIKDYELDALLSKAFAQMDKEQIEKKQK